MEKDQTTEIIDTKRAVSNDFFGIAIMKMLTSAMPDHDEFAKFVDKSNGKLELKASINGVDVKFSDFVNVLKNQWEHSVKCSAKEMIEDRFSIKEREILDLLECVKNTLKDRAKQSDINIFETEY